MVSAEMAAILVCTPGSGDLLNSPPDLCIKKSPFSKIMAAFSKTMPPFSKIMPPFSKIMPSF
jgi:hypothetical protein